MENGRFSQFGFTAVTLDPSGNSKAKKMPVVISQTLEAQSTCCCATSTCWHRKKSLKFAKEVDYAAVAVWKVSFCFVFKCFPVLQSKT